MTRSSAFACAAALLALSSSGAIASQPTDQNAAAAQNSEQIVVVGQRQTEEAIHAFVEQMSAVPQRGAHQLSRWDNTVCPGVIGLQARYAQFINDRLAQRAEAVGLDVGEPGCRANILIAISNDPDAIAHDLYDHHKTLLGYYQQRGHGTLGRRALLQDFVNSIAPVRWWHVSRTITRDGDVIGDQSSNLTASMADPGRAVQSGGAPVVMLGSGSTRISDVTHQDFGVAFIIVDARKLHGVSFEALADYLAMVTLAQIDPRADVSSFPTILNVFAHHGDPSAMTEWDVAYLQGLYGATQDARNAQQEGEIAHTMAGALQH